MSAPPVEAVETDPAATPLPNEQTVNPQTEAKEATGTDAAPAPAEEQTQAKEETKPEESKAEEAKSDEQLANGDKPAEAKEDNQESRGTKRSRSPERHDGRRERKPYRKTTTRTDYESLPETDDPVEIRKQVEFYFSDSNLMQDKFLFDTVGGSKNNAVPLKLIHSFKRMKRFQPYSAVVAALKESETLELVNNDADVKRKVPLPEDLGTKYDAERTAKIVNDRTLPRSIYAKGFGPETTTSQLDIEKFFEPYGPVRAVRLRRVDDKSKAFKGSVFVEFDSEQTQQQFLALDPKPTFQGRELKIMSKQAYVDQKIEDIKAGRVKPNNGNGRGGHRGRGRGGRGGRGGRDRDGGDKDDWKGRREDFQKRRGGHRPNRGGRRDDRNGGDRKGEEEKPQQQQQEKKEVQKDARGVPVVAATGGAGAESPKKRAREEDAGAEPEAKKSKTDAAEATA